MSEFIPMKVRWIDARANSSFLTPGECKALKPAEIWSAGWVYEFEDRVVVAQDYYPETFDQAEGYRFGFVIPRVCILELVRLKEEQEEGGNTNSA